MVLYCTYSYNSAFSHRHLPGIKGPLHIVSPLLVWLWYVVVDPYLCSSGVYLSMHIEEAHTSSLSPCMHPFIHLSTCLSVHLSVCPVCLFTYLCVYLSIHLSAYLPTYLPIPMCLSSIHLSIHLSIYLPG